MLVELDDAFLRSEADDDARVVILGGHGPVFSSGHDVGKVGVAGASPDLISIRRIDRMGALKNRSSRVIGRSGISFWTTLCGGGTYAR